MHHSSCLFLVCFCIFNMLEGGHMTVYAGLMTVCLAFALFISLLFYFLLGLCAIIFFKYSMNIVTMALMVDNVTPRKNSFTSCYQRERACFWDAVWRCASVWNSPSDDLAICDPAEVMQFLWRARSQNNGKVVKTEFTVGAAGFLLLDLSSLHLVLSDRK